MKRVAFVAHVEGTIDLPDEMLESHGRHIPTLNGTVESMVVAGRIERYVVVAGLAADGVVIGKVLSARVTGRCAEVPSA